jgi:predicted esterase
MKISLLALVVASFAWLGAFAQTSQAGPPPPPAWCTVGSESFGGDACYYEPEPMQAEQQFIEGKSTLVIFLHSLIRADSDWQWQQQRLMMRTADRMGFSLFMPRGLAGVGPGAQKDVLAWPGSPRMQEAYETALLASWDAARAALERRRGAPFERVLVFGFSNGAYYATSLAVRDRYAAHGYGVFAGGSGSKFNRILARKAERRAPIFVGFGTKDPAVAHMTSLVRMLADLHWPHAVKRAAIGHWVSDAQLQLAFRFLNRPRPEGLAAEKNN